MMKGRIGSFLEKNFQLRDSIPKPLPVQNDKPPGLEFDFQLAGGPKHTEILIASAMIKNGSHSHAPISHLNLYIAI